MVLISLNILGTFTILTFVISTIGEILISAAKDFSYRRNDSSVVSRSFAPQRNACHDAEQRDYLFSITYSAKISSRQAFLGKMNGDQCKSSIKESKIYLGRPFIYNEDLIVVF
jgi:hypothetical protein